MEEISQNTQKAVKKYGKLKAFAIVFYALMMLLLAVWLPYLKETVNDGDEAIGKAFIIIIFLPISLIASGVLAGIGELLSVIGLIKTAKGIKIQESTKGGLAFFIVLTVLPFIVLGAFFLLLYM